MLCTVFPWKNDTKQLLFLCRIPMFFGIKTPPVCKAGLFHTGFQSGAGRKASIVACEHLELILRRQRLGVAVAHEQHRDKRQRDKQRAIREQEHISGVRVRAS